jgi:UPF0716 protein FxsA
MFFYLLLAFIGIPLIEIALFIEVGGAIGTPATIAVVIGTAFLGAWMLRRQGLSTAQTAQAKLQRGEMPVEQAFDGMFLVFAGGLLLTPGFLTDAIGFSLFVPQIRAALRSRIVARARRSGAFHMSGSMSGSGMHYTDEAEMWKEQRPPANDTASTTTGAASGTSSPKTIDGSAIETDTSEGTPGAKDSPWRDK